MNRLLTRWDLLGISFVILVGTALHFAFVWSGNWKPMALVAPVNESVWEHFKLAFWPALLWAFLENGTRELNARAFWSAKGYALLVIPILIAIIFYGYTAVLGRNLFALDIATFVVAVVATQLASAQLLRANIHTRWAHSIGIGLLLCQIAVYSTFTYYALQSDCLKTDAMAPEEFHATRPTLQRPVAKVGGIASSSSKSNLGNVAGNTENVFRISLRRMHAIAPPPKQSEPDLTISGL